MTREVERTANLSRILSNHSHSLAAAFGVLRTNPGAALKLVLEHATHEEELWLQAAEHSAGLRSEGFKDTQIFRARGTP